MSERAGGERSPILDDVRPWLHRDGERDAESLRQVTPGDIEVYLRANGWQLAAGMLPGYWSFVDANGRDWSVRMPSASTRTYPDLVWNVIQLLATMRRNGVMP